MEEHRFSYPTVIPLRPGATAHGPRAASLGLGAAQVGEMSGKHLPPSAVGQLGFSAPRSPSGHRHLGVALGGHG